MSTVALGYPLDPTGTSANNKVQGELHQLSNKKLRVISPKYGAFYVDGLVVKNAQTNAVMTKGAQYIVAYRYDVPSARFDKDVCGLIVIKDANVGSVAIDYQAVGGDFSQDASNIVALLDRRVANNRPEQWAPLIEPVDSEDDFNLRYFRGNRSGFEMAVTSINRLATAKMENSPAYMDKLKQYAKEQSELIAQDSGASVQVLIEEHNRDPHAHDQYAKIAEVNSAISLVLKPLQGTPINGAINVALANFNLVGSPYYAMYDITQGAAEFQIAKDAAFTNIVFTATPNGAVTSAAFTGKLDLNTTYFWRYRYRSSEMVWSDWSNVSQFVTTNVGVTTPTMTSPTNGATGIAETPSLATSAFAMSAGTDTHVSTDWQLFDGPNATGNLVYSSLNNTVNKTSITVPAGVLSTNKKYYARARHNTGSSGSSSWSNEISFTTASSFLPTQIGTPYQGGFWGGTVSYNGKTYGIVVAPKSAEANLQWRTTTTDVPGAYSELDSVANTAAMKASTNSPAADYVRNLTTGGYTDWQIPAAGVLDLLHARMRPSLSTITAQFQTGGSEAWAVNAGYWSSTLYYYLQDTSYYTQGAPIYDTVYEEHTYSGTNQRWVTEGSNWSPTCPHGITPGAPYQLGEPNGNQTFYQWDCSGTYYTSKTVIVGYEQGEYVEQYTDRYEAKYRLFTDNAVTAYTGQRGAQNVRAIRLVDLTGMI